MSFKAETFIALIILVVGGLVVGIFISVYSPEKPHEYQVETKDEQPFQEIVRVSDFTKYVSMGKNICEGCHLSGKKFIPQAYEIEQHAGGGAYCLKCHKIDHNIHPVNDNITCERCHGIGFPRVPEFKDGKIVCEECHDYPDPLLPSKGNIIVIHRPRDVDCTRCHTDSCLKCHEKMEVSEGWEKRLSHFNTLLRTDQK